MGAIEWKRSSEDSNYLRYFMKGGSGSGGMEFIGTMALKFNTSGSPGSYLYTEKALEVYITCASTNASTSFEPILFYTTMTGAGQVGGRVKCYMTTNVALGGWSNAFKAHAVYGASGKTTGLGSAICAEMDLSAGTVDGNYAPLEIEFNIGSSAAIGTKAAMIFMSANGADVATYRAGGALIILNGMGTASSDTNIFHTTGTVSATHGLRIDIDGTDYDILLKASTYA